MKTYKKVHITVLLLTLLLSVNSVSGDDYYWIGGSGNWSDINHWAQTSGGSVLQIQIPTSDDNVFFDENSFTGPGQTVTVNTENAICRSMDWTGAQFNPFLFGTLNNNIRIYGSVTFISTMNQNFLGTFTFESTSTGNTIKSNSQSFHNNIIFDGIGGEWTLLDALVAPKIFLNNGNFSTGGQVIVCNGFNSSVANSRILDFSNSTVTVNGPLTLSGQNLIFSGNGSLIKMRGSINCFDGDTLDFDKALFLTNGSITSNEVYSRFTNIYFQAGGTLQGSCFADSVLADSSSASVAGHVTINYAFFRDGASFTGFNKILEAFTDSICIIDGTNEIGLISIKKQGIVSGTNTIEEIIIGDTGFIRQSNVIGKIRIGKTSYFTGTNQVRNAFMNCDGFLSGNNVFDTLTMTAGCRYFLDHDSIQTIHSLLDAAGTCKAPIFIKSTYNGRAATIQKTNGGVGAEFISLRDVHIAGSGPFNAAHSVDLGNNNGWTIETTGGKDLYWVNGQGNWNDTQHWSENSGGQGGSCPPTEIDNVFFNGGSMSGNDTVFINTKIAVCKDMDWTGCSAGTVLDGADTNFLKIYGSLTFTENMRNQFQGEVHFEATEPGQFIDEAGNIFNYNVRMQGRGGGWELKDKFRISDTLFDEHGGFKTNDYNVLAGQFYSTDTNFRILDLGSDTVFIRGKDIPAISDIAWKLNAQNLSLDADSVIIVIIAPGQTMMNFKDSEPLTFFNVYFKGGGSTLMNKTYGVYNLVTFEQGGEIREYGTIDTATFYAGGTVFDSDTIKTVIFHANGTLTGMHIVEIAYYYGEGLMDSKNKIDTALFYSQGTIYGANEVDTTIIYGRAFIEGENIIRTATLRGNGYFEGRNTFDELNFAYSKLYKFHAGDTTIINDSLFANGRCTGPIFLVSDTHEYESYIEKVNGNALVDFANLRDIHAIGPEIPFIATNSINLGGNSEWDIFQQDSKALYWVGNSGNWSDSLHWAPVSGGEPGYCIPTPIDDVYFDVNSFTDSSLVNVNVSIAACHNMTWNDAGFSPTFHGTDQNDLYVYGSLYLNPEMIEDFTGTIYFSSNEKEKQIKSAGNKFKGDLVFDGRSGSWYLADSLTDDANIYHKRGDLYTLGNNFNVMYFYSVDSNLRSLDLDTSKIRIGSPIEGGIWTIRKDSLYFDADSTRITCYGMISNSGKGYENKIVYNDILYPISGSLKNIDIYGNYDDVTFVESGSLSGRCNIDSLLLLGGGNVSGSDSINYCYFGGNGNLSGGNHVVNTAIFDGPGKISGNCKVQIGLFYDAGLVTGTNYIDTTIFYSTGSIQGDNFFNSQVLIYGNGIINGTNTIHKNLVVHGIANIFQENLIHKALLLDWGYLGGQNVFDILTFTPGKTYTLTANTVQTVNDTFNIRGNNCFPINLKSSSTQHVQAGVFMPDGEVSGDFIIMKDIDATGSAQFFAGGHSDNIINNTGWIWDNAPGYIYGLGEDTALLCQGNTIELSTENFNGNENTVYQWFDGSTDPTYTVSEPGDYGVTVFYSDDCSVPGSITVEELPSPQLDLGPDTEICEGTAFYIPAGNYASYLWSDGSTADSITAINTGLYFLTVTNVEGCSATDSVGITVLPAPEVDLGENMIVHNGDVVVLDAGYPDGSHLWSTGQTSQYIQAQGIEGGNPYWVTVEYAGCKASDTIVIDEYPYCTVDVPTAFSPNGDDLNDILYVLGSGIQYLDFKIFDRFGQLIFETDDITRGWDGNYNEVKQEPEVYLYYLKAICFDGLVTKKKGNITLLR